MDTLYLLFTIPQWILFASIVVIIYAWVEKKFIFWKIGCLSLTLLGIFALIAIVSGFVIPDIYIAEEALPIDDLDPEELPKEMFMVPIYWGLVVNGILSLVSLVLLWMQKKGFKWMTIVTMLTSLGLFFMLYEALKS